MKSTDQITFYYKVGKYLTLAREHKKLTISQVARKAGEQFNTVRAIEEGNNFHFHQVVWICGILGVDVNTMIREIMGGDNGSIKLESFI